MRALCRARPLGVVVCSGRVKKRAGRASVREPLRRVSGGQCASASHASSACAEAAAALGVSMAAAAEEEEDESLLVLVLWFLVAAL